jgi:hypothetical protein
MRRSGTSSNISASAWLRSLLGKLTDIKATVDQPIPVDVTGKVAVEGKVDTRVTISVDGPGRVTGMSTTSSGHAQGNVGTSMPHIKAGPR